MKKIPVILDGDPGHDDAVAWVFAKASEKLDIKAVCSVNGNQTIEKTTYNARRIMALLGIDAPFAKGAEKPLFAPVMSAGNWHGESGLDGPKMPEPNQAVYQGSAVDLMKQVILDSKDPVTIIATGPLTNVAELILAERECTKNIARISIMGGGLGFGNWTAAAEFNILEDPEAADIVFRSGIPITMAPLNVTEKALITLQDIDRIRSIGNQVSQITADWISFFIAHPMAIGYKGAPVHDPCAVLALVEPEIFKMQDYHVDVVLDGEYTRGETLCSFEKRENETSNVTACVSIDQKAYVDLLCKYLHFYDGRVVSL